jgi:hypothetical protein
MGLTGVAANVLHHQGALLARVGDAAGAISRADGAIEAFHAQGDRRMEAAARLYSALFLVDAGNTERAESEVHTAMEVAGATPPLRAFCYGILARIHLANSGAHKAEAPAREAHGILEALGGVEEGESYIRLAYAETLHALGRSAAARDAIKTARVRILERAAMIQDPAWKESFLERVRENARTIELAREWRAV